MAACLVLLIGASLAMHGIAASIRTGDYVGCETEASIFHGGAALGYIVIGLLAFLLGVCVTVLCFLLLCAAITFHATYNLLIAYGGGKIVCFPIIAEKITEHLFLESCFLAALKFF